ncbi:MAG: hypothetical protein IJ480_09120 [Clostridia bacterium]|nr:hypothetical protein [Clostridia bacterium]
MFRKNIALLLCAVILASALGSCGENTADSTNETADTADTAAVSAETLSAEEQKQQEKEAYYAALPAVVEEGADIDFISSTWVDISAEELTGQKFNDALYNRNLEVEEKLGLKVVEHRQDDRSNVLKLVKNNVTAGDGTYDVISTMTNQTASMFTSDLLIDMNAVPNLQLEGEWWNQSANENFSFGGVSFCLISSLCQNADDVAAIILFNKDMCVDYNIGLPYDDVKEGKWTYDRMWEMVEALPLDSNGDGAMDDRDIMGIVGQTQDVQASMIACGVDFFTKDDNDIPQFILQTEENVDKFNKLFDMLTDKTRVCLVDGYKFAGEMAGWTYWSDKFLGGEALFMLQYPGNMSSYLEMEADYGVLPMPKYNEEQESYRTMTNTGFTSCLSVPKVHDNDISDIGLVMEVMSYLSLVDVKPIYISNYLEQRYIRDEESAEMMMLAIETTYYDPGFAMSEQWSNPMGIPTSVVVSGSNTLISSIEKKVTAIENAIQKTLDAVSE